MFHSCAGLFEPCIVPRRLISRQFERWRECRLSRIVGIVAEPFLA
jgi:hypothetical protein